MFPPTGTPVDVVLTDSVTDCSVDCSIFVGSLLVFVCASVGSVVTVS